MGRWLVGGYPGRTLARRTVTVGALGGVVALALRAGHGTSPAATAPAAAAPAAAAPRAARTGTGAPGAPVLPAPAPPTPVTPAPRELPRGGRSLFPRYRLVGYCGSPQAAGLGRLGLGNLDARAAEIEQLATRYADGRQGQPVFELITVVAQRYPGPDGMYRARVDPAVIESYLAAARRHRALLLLNIQPGRARFLDEVRSLRRWLAEPEVGVALDPEWAVHGGQVPGRVFGHTTGAELDQVIAFLADVVRASALPEKAMVVHQLAPSVLTGIGALHARKGVAVIKSVDGIGTAAQKVGTWQRLVRDLPPHVHPGFKLFFEEDTRGGAALMTPAQVLGLHPTPEYVLYE